MVTNKDIQALNEFLENRNVDYVLTGTAALISLSTDRERLIIRK